MVKQKPNITTIFNPKKTLNTIRKLVTNKVAKEKSIARNDLNLAINQKNIKAL